MNISRRKFLKGVPAVAAAIALAPTLIERAGSVLTLADMKRALRALRRNAIQPTMMMVVSTPSQREPSWVEEAAAWQEFYRAPTWYG